jgi:predicted N-acyltransferase
MGDSEHDAATIKAIGSMSRIDAEAWNACAGPENPFVQHAFLEALEESGSATAETGWAPYHLVIEDKSESPLGVAPMYVKGHSQGEFVFDHNWAHAYESAGGKFYPKLLIAVPFTPATGPRLLVRPDQDRALIEGQLIAGGVEAANQLDLSSVNVNFPTERQWDHLGESGFLQRTGEQFHWLNHNYETFDDFLAALSSRKRKAIRRERRGAMASDIEIEVITGSDLREEHWDAFFEFYMDTGSRKWGRPYLTRAFFSIVTETMPEQIVMILARKDGDYIAGALNFLGTDTLFGRYWGCKEDHPFLHFEVCYYRAIDFAIEHGLARVEAGAQGHHKLSRGYLPVHTYSAHWIRDAGFRRAVAHYLEQERAHVSDEIEMLDAYSPFRKDDIPTKTD